MRTFDAFVTSLFGALAAGLLNFEKLAGPPTEPNAPLALAIATYIGIACVALTVFFCIRTVAGSITDRFENGEEP